MDNGLPFLGLFQLPFEAAAAAAVVVDVVV